MPRRSPSVHAIVRNKHCVAARASQRYCNRMRYVWSCVLVLVVMVFAPPAQAERVALVIGNGAYQASAPLANAERDARDVAAALKQIGFHVFQGENLDQQGTLQLVQDFARALRPEDTALLYYAGHGVQLGAQNYLVPVDARTGSEQDLSTSSVALQAILRTMELRANARIVILDACRDNPFVATSTSRSSSQPSRGLAKIEAGVGSFIAFATQPGNTASDGAGRNSPFTTALLRHIATPDANIHAVMRKVRQDVLRDTDGLQVPWENSSLVSEIFLTPQSAPADEPTASGTETKSGDAKVALQSNQAPPAAETSFHYVDGLDPNGDNFLALRSAPAGAGHRLAKMGAGTLLQVLGKRGNWMNVRTRDGVTGWAHGRWIFCCRATGESVRNQQQPATASCDDLWYERNAIWHRNGYCFRGARGKSTFGNAGCSRNQDQARAAMSPRDLASVDAIVAEERRRDCR